jgi:hypothetical protein
VTDHVFHDGVEVATRPFDETSVRLPYTALALAKVALGERYGPERVERDMGNWFRFDGLPGAVANRIAGVRGTSDPSPSWLADGAVRLGAQVAHVDFARVAGVLPH